MDLFHKIYQNIIKDSYVPFIIASLTGLRISHMVYMETFKCLKIQKGQIISAKPLKIGLQADFSPKWWVGTSDRTGQNSLKLVHSLLKRGHDRKIDQK